ncbi:MAG: HupE/UreJ family protein [Bryobacteraceae bacterium]
MKRLFLLVAVALAAQAHEIGTTRVSALFKDAGTYVIEVVTDAAALEEKLAAAQGSPVTPAQFEELFRQRVKVAFDGATVHPAISYSVVPAIDAQSAPAATIRLTGSIPAGARHFTWNFGWTFATYSLEIRNQSSQTATQWLEGGDTSAPVVWAKLAPQSGSALRYLKLGFTHIMPNGIDHMLFVLGIYFLSRRARSVLLQVSAFTLAHSITLGLSLYGLVSISPSIVEPLIALSIAYVAIENIFLSELKPWRVALVFAFGLLHGLGFAGALRELNLPRSEFATALIAFNVGVEAGQLAVIAVAFLLVGWYASKRDWYRSRIAIPASIMIACIAVYWTVERAIY